MIALNKDMPETCASCPCLATIHAYGKDTNKKDTLLRVCNVGCKIIKMIKWEEGDPAPDDTWYDFTKPDWCPWIQCE